MDPARESLPVGDETFLFVEGLPLGDSLAHNGDLFGCTHNGDFFDSAHNGASLHRAPLWWDSLGLSLVHMHETEETFVIVVL